MRRLSALLFLALLATLPAQAGLVEVQITGTVEYNQVRPPATFNRDVVKSGDRVIVTFRLDSQEFVDSTNFPTRGYVIVPDSYTITFEAATGPVTTAFPVPYPFGDTPYFVIRDNDPRVDGFFVSSSSVDFPFQYLWVDQPARLAPYFQQSLEVSYPESRLPSLRIYDATGTYDFDGLSSYYFTMVDAFFDAMSFAYEQMTIARVPVEVPADIVPDRCPNPLSASKPILPVAILGTDKLDVTTIDPASIRLNGVPALQSSLADVGMATEPYIGKTDCPAGCIEGAPDTYLDLTLKFDARAIAESIGSFDGGACIPVRLTGNFYPEYDEAAPIVGEIVISEDLVVPDNEAVGVFAGDDRLSRHHEVKKDPKSPTLDFDTF